MVVMGKEQDLPVMYPLNRDYPDGGGRGSPEAQDTKNYFCGTLLG